MRNWSVTPSVMVVIIERGTLPKAWFQCLQEGHYCTPSGASGPNLASLLMQEEMKPF